MGGSGLMDTNNCIQYRVTGGGEAGAGAMSTGGYRPVVVSSNGDNSDTNHGGTNTTALSNVQVGSAQVKCEADAECSANNVQAVLASPINGQFYVIGNPSDVLGNVGQRTIAPRYKAIKKSIYVTFAFDQFHRTGPFAVDQISSQNNKEDKIGTRRATHNEVERRRRDNINNWIMKLSKLLPDCGNSGDSGGGGSQGKQSQSKGGILAKACEFLADMRNINQRLADSLKHTEEANQENERLSSQIEQLQVRK